MFELPEETSPASPSGKMSPEYSVPPITLSGVSLQGLPATTSLLSQAHDLNRDGPLSIGAGKRKPVAMWQSGQTLVLLLAPAAQSHGDSSMPNISIWPNDARVCLLSQVLETISIPLRYFLSSKACAGILRRAEKRGKKLPAMLYAALRWQARSMYVPVEVSPEPMERAAGM
jgi:hypothetical protein